MGTAAVGSHAGRMTTSTLAPARVPTQTATVTTRPANTHTTTSRPTTSRPSAPATTARQVSSDRVPLLALLAPLLLFAHGIVEWVDGLDTLDDARGLGNLGGLGGLAAAHADGALSVAAGVLLVLSVAGFAWLTTSLGARLRHLPLAVPTALLAAFGAGATGAVWLGRLTGLLDDTMPSALASGGAVLTGLALAAVLVALALEGRMPVGSLALATIGALLLVLPWGLGPLGSLVLLIALAPLTRPESAETV
jgi:hypothetical protein